MKTKFLTKLAALIACLCLIGCLAACANPKGNQGEQGNQGNQGEQGEQEEQGEQGEQEEQGGTEYQKFDEATLAQDWAAAFAAENFTNYKVEGTAEGMVTQGDIQGKQVSTSTITVEGTKGHLVQEIDWVDAKQKMSVEYYADWSTEPGKGYEKFGGAWQTSYSAVSVIRQFDTIVEMCRDAADQFVYNAEKNGYEPKAGAKLTMMGQEITFPETSTLLLQFKDGKLVRSTNSQVIPVQDRAPTTMSAVSVITYGGQTVTTPTDLPSAE